ncbi:MAG: hypothetical protein FWF36_05645, partial [Propionibacteriaceae bacterium]|nr:hypothetical protein [Propionibacteriaceae bacterium]
MKIRRLFTAGAATVAALGLALTACTSPANTIPSSSAPAGSDTTSAAKTYTIGVAVIMSHPALQAVQDGFEEVLK